MIETSNSKRKLQYPQRNSVPINCTSKQNDGPKLRRRGSSKDSQAMTSSKHTQIGISRPVDCGSNSCISSDSSYTDEVKSCSAEIPDKEILSREGKRLDTHMNPISEPQDISSMTEEFTFLGSPRAGNIQESSSNDILGQSIGCIPAARKQTEDRRDNNIRKKKNPMNLSLNLVEVEEQYQLRAKDMNSREQQESYKSVCSRVTDYLFVGGATAAQNKSQLMDFGVTHIINCAGKSGVNHFPSEFFYLNIYLSDHNSEDITRYFYAVFEYIESARSMNGRVFIHCVKGISRSPAIAIAYIIWKKKFTFDEAFNMLKVVRPVVNPNPGFVFQISEWENTRLKSESNLYRIDISKKIKHQGNMNKSPCIVGPLSSICDDHFVNQSNHQTASDCFVIVSPLRCYIWYGKKVDEDHKTVAKYAVQLLSKFESTSAEFQCISAGEESHEFWKHLSSVSKKRNLANDTH